MKTKLETLTTEKRNVATTHIDRLSVTDILEMINKEDCKVPRIVAKEMQNIAKAVEAVVGAFKKGGRIFYVGAGTSGRLGVLDSAECPPTFGTNPSLVQGIIAGGDVALRRAVEGAEDNYEQGKIDVAKKRVGERDVVIGLSASGRSPYVMGALHIAKKLKAKTVSISCNKKSEISRVSEISINPIVGPEVITGSTRMKAGTAEKLILNMISTTAMIKFGKVKGNLMVNLKAVSKKLKYRAINIVMMETGVNRKSARLSLKQSNFNIEEAVKRIKENRNAK